MAEYLSILRNIFGRQRSDILVTSVVIGLLTIIIFPIPAILLDFLMIMNIGTSLMVLLVVLYSKDPLEFSIFPTLLLISTVFGLTLNIASTRLILFQGPSFNGQVVRAFATFMVGTQGSGNGLVTGLIIFIIIIVVQFMVISKGSTRISEVAARFALDAMPGKQMAIDAEFGSGSISEEEARRRRKKVEQTSDFYGRMDGSTKFISGTVKAGLLITALNIIGGLIAGGLRGESIVSSLQIYSRLTVGDGLVSQIPTLIVSIATGLVVTRAGAEQSFGEEARTQFSEDSRVFFLTGTFLALISLVPSFPWYILVPIAILLLYTGFLIQIKINKLKAEKQRLDAMPAPEEPMELAPVVPLDPLSIELGYGLIPIVDKEHGAELLDRITNIRKETALELGIVVPKIRIIDNMRLGSADYSIKIKGVEIGRGEIHLGSFLAINPGGEREQLKGEHTKDPAFGLAAQWIDVTQKEEAERLGYTVVDPPSIIATHLTELIRNNAAEILGRQEVQAMIDSLKDNYPTAIEEVRKEFSIGDIQKVLQGLLREQISIRNMVTILETIADYSGITKDVYYIIEKVRQSLARQISLRYAGDEKKLNMITIEPSLEKSIVDSRMDTTNGPVAALEPQLYKDWTQALLRTVQDVQNKGHMAVILCSEAARILVRSCSEREVPDIVVLSTMEVVKDLAVDIIATIDL